MEDLMPRLSHISVVATLVAAVTAPTGAWSEPASHVTDASCSDGALLLRACYDVSARKIGPLRGTVAWLDRGRVLQVISSDARMCGLDDPPPRVACPRDAIVTLDDGRPDLVPALAAEALRRDAERTATLRWQLHLLELQDEQLVEMLSALDTRRADHAPPRDKDLRVATPSGTYLPIAEIHPGQLRKSSLNVRAKVRRAIERHVATESPSRGRTPYTFAYDNGQSIVPPDEPLPVIKGPPGVGYVLVDGHHDVLASLALGATTVPIQQVADLSDMSEADFWDRATRDGYVYPFALGGKREIPPRSFDDLIDDPNRYFAAVTSRMCKSNGDDARRSVGAEYPLWVKIGRDVPFIEFKISDRLSAEHFDYGATKSYKDDPDHPPSDVVAQARAILLGEPHVDGLRVVPARVSYTQIPNLCSTPTGVIDIR
jgi:hypothetical protein